MCSLLYDMCFLRVTGTYIMVFDQTNNLCHILCTSSEPLRSMVTQCNLLSALLLLLLSVRNFALYTTVNSSFWRPGILQTGIIRTVGCTGLKHFDLVVLRCLVSLTETCYITRSNCMTELSSSVMKSFVSRSYMYLRESPDLSPRPSLATSELAYNLMILRPRGSGHLHTGILFDRVRLERYRSRHVCYKCNLNDVVR